MEKVTIYTLAQELGMSVSAVSRAFNPNAKLSAEKRRIILEAAARHGFSPNKMASRLSRQHIRVGIIFVQRIAGYDEQMLAGLRAAYDAYRSYKLLCDFRLLPQQTPPERISELLDEFSAAGFDGVILKGVYDEQTAQKLRSLTDDRMKAALVSNDLPDSGRLFASIPDPDATAHIAAQLLSVFAPPGDRGVLVFSGSMRSVMHQRVLASFTRYAPQYGLKILRCCDTQDIPERAAQQIAEACADFSSIGGVYISSANSVPVCRYLKAHGLGARTAVVATDLFDELNSYLTQGVVNALIFHDPYAQGYSVLERLYRALAEDVQPPDVVTVLPKIVLESNLSLYRR